MNELQGFLRNIKRVKEATSVAVDYAIVNGMVTRTRERPSSSEVVQHAPFTLAPSAVPRQLFHQALNVQQDFNLLMYKLSRDIEFLRTTYQSVLSSDEFTRKLFKIHETVLKENPKKTELSILRSDYMFHLPGSGPASLKQVEINTIAASFNGIGTERIHAVHSHTMQHCGLKAHTMNLVKNDALNNIAKGLILAWEKYGTENAVIVFVVSKTEQNIFDQRCLEFRINHLNPNVRVIRCMFSDIVERGSLKDGCSFIGNEEIAVVYFRAGYVPNDYATEADWEARLLLDRSKAVNCPSAGLQLVGAKKMQQVLALPGTVEQFVKDQAVVDRIRNTFVSFHGLEMGQKGNEAVALAIANSGDFVLKPQLEGGGNNLYNEDLINKLNEIGKDERRCSYILMEKIRPMPIETVIVKAGSYQLQPVEGVSELGVYGVFLASGDDIHHNSCAGHLLRTKESHHNDGGVAAGVAVLDSPYLI